MPSSIGKPRTVRPARSGSARANAPSHIFRENDQAAGDRSDLAAPCSSMICAGLALACRDEHHGRTRASPRRCRRASEWDLVAGASDQLGSAPGGEVAR